MNQISRQSLFALLLLGVAALFTLSMTQRDLLLGRATGASGHGFVADIDNWQQTDRQRLVYSPFDLRVGPGLEQVPLQIGAWKGVDVPETNQEVFILLEPEKLTFRRYDLPDGRYLWLSMLGSRQAKSFHSAQICYTADGWTTALDSVSIPVNGQDLYALKIRADKGPFTHVALYFYLFPNPSRNPEDGTVLFKVTAPLTGSEQDTVNLARQFVQQFFSSVQA